MLGYNRWQLFKGLAASFCAVGIVSLALIYFFPAPPSKVVMATAFKGSSSPQDRREVGPDAQPNRFLAKAA
jgi:hypothetical protein